MNKKSKKEREKTREEVVLALPGFLNQLLLFLNSGMVLMEALEKIAISYGTLEKEQRNEFTDNLSEINKRCMETGEALLYVFSSYAKSSGIKEIARISNILLDNKDKGTELVEKLGEESNNLWEEHKRLVLEKIRLNESKMSFPLGMLLIALIIMTAAPALLAMK